MISFDTLGQVINNSIAVHRGAADIYHSLLRRDPEERERLLLKRLIAAEERLIESETAFMKEAGDRLLKTYMQYTLQRPAEYFIEDVRPAAHKSPTIEQIGSTAQRLHDYQTELLEGAIREINGEGSVDLLQNLLQLEKVQQRNFALNAEGARQM